MKARKDSDSKQIFTPWHVYQISTENETKSEGLTSIVQLANGVDKAQMFHPWDQGKQNYLSVKRSLLASAKCPDGSEDNCTYDVREEEEGGSHTRDEDAGDKSVGEDASVDNMRKDRTTANKMDDRDVDGRKEHRNQNKKEFRGSAAKSAQGCTEIKGGQRDIENMDQCQHEINGKPDNVCGQWNYKSISDNNLCSGTNEEWETDTPSQTWNTARPHQKWDMGKSHLGWDMDKPCCGLDIGKAHQGKDVDKYRGWDMDRYSQGWDVDKYQGGIMDKRRRKRDRHPSDSVGVKTIRKQYMESSDSDAENKENFKLNLSFTCNNHSVQKPRQSSETVGVLESPSKMMRTSRVLLNSVENLMQYAEILYKCKLCTTLPSILTSSDSFLSHVTEEHLPNNDERKECGRCSLRFGTVEDLRAHTLSEHPNYIRAEIPLDKSIKVSQQISSRVPTVKQSKERGKRHKMAQSYLRSNSDDVDPGPQNLVKDVDRKENRDIAPHSPKLVIAHGVERSIHHTPTHNMTCLQKLTDQIIASNKEDVNGSPNLCTKSSTAKMAPCYTAEFGQYTKLVREGGNIVYFCQLCNWKSQVKVQFQTHCSSSSHLTKLQAADHNDLAEQAVPKTSEFKGRSSNSDKYKEPVGWSPRGHLSFLAETTGFYVGTSNKKAEEEHGCVQGAKPGEDGDQGQLTVKETENKGKAEGAKMNRCNKIAEKRKDRMEDDVSSDGHTQKGTENRDNAAGDKQSNKVMKMEDEDKGIRGQCMDEDDRDEKVVIREDEKEDREDKAQVRQNKRKRAAPVALRNQVDCEEGWGSDGDDNDSDDSGSSCRQGSGGKGSLLGLPSGSSEERGKLCTSSPEGVDMPYPMGPWQEGGIPAAPHSSMICIRSTPPPVVNMYPDRVRPQKYSPAVGEEEMERTASMIRNYFESQLGFTGLDQPIRSATTKITSQTCTRNGELSQRGGGSAFHGHDTLYQYNCSLCDFGCTDMSEYRQHFDTEHNQSQDMDAGDGMSDGRGESWKMWKIKEVLPELICVYPRGNVSRDLLLQKISVVLSLPEATQWGPACNKAVREHFPHSLAQRKGKYKKTFFFGVALTEHVQEQEDPSDGEGVTYQPLRDMSQDMEKILGHLHSLVQWTGDLESGVSRDEILELLKGRIEEPDVQHWGVQCNRAIRVLFPNVEMKRKGKYKTTVFFGVDFRQDMHKQAFLPNKRGRPRKFPFLDPHQQTDQHSLSWLETLQSGQEELYPQDGSSGAPRHDRGVRVTRGWGPRLGDGDKSCADQPEETEWSPTDSVGEYSPLLRYRKQDGHKGMDLSIADKHSHSSLVAKPESYLSSLWARPSSWRMTPPGDTFDRTGVFRGEQGDGGMILQHLPTPAFPHPSPLDSSLLYRYRSWPRSGSEDGDRVEQEEEEEEEEENDAADGDDEDSQESIPKFNENSSHQPISRPPQLANKTGVNKLDKTELDKSSESNDSDGDCGNSTNTEELMSKGDNSVLVNDKSPQDSQDNC